MLVYNIYKKTYPDLDPEQRPDSVYPVRLQPGRGPAPAAPRHCNHEGGKRALSRGREFQG